MSQHTYTVNIDQSSLDVICVIRDDGQITPWNDADFTTWNAAQKPPFVLSAAQLLIQQAKALTFAQFEALTQAQRYRVLFRLMNQALQGVV
jgi:hypothetical protein